jgi:hypothetical protein
MNLLPLIAGLVLIGAGAAGLVANARVNAGLVTDEATLGFTGDEIEPGDDDFSYEGKVDHTPGVRRRIFASVWLILLIAAVGALVAGGLILAGKVIVTTVLQFSDPTAPV